jgi:hypothetical protein
MVRAAKELIGPTAGLYTVAEVPDFHSNVPALKQDRVNAEDVDTRAKAQLR